MLEAIRDLGQGGATLLIGLPTGAAWIMTIVAPNVSYDRLDASRADGHVRELLKSASDQIAFVLIGGAAFAILGGAIGAGIIASLAAFGFFSNRWTLASFKRGEAPPDAKRSKKTQRVLAVSLTLIFTFVAAIAGKMAVLGL